MPSMSSLAAHVLTLWRRRAAARGKAVEPPHAMGTLINDTLRRDLALAAEHVQSIRWLLEIAREHEQPIPGAALRNLELVSKHLCEMQQRIDTQISSAAPRQEPQAPPRPRRPSSGCHASPSGRSTPFG